MKREGNLFIPNKTKYVRRKKKEGECILCSVVNKDKNFPSLEIFRSKNFFITANLYPYNPGHIMIVPIRHFIDVREMNQEEMLEMIKLQNICLDVLEKTYNPSGFNIGYNIGQWSGASIPHIHLHIVPRFINELGYIDILTGSRIIIDDPKKMVRKLKKHFNHLKIKF